MYHKIPMLVILKVLTSIAFFVAGLFVSWHAWILFISSAFNVFYVELLIAATSFLILVSTKVAESISGQSLLPSKSSIMTATKDYTSITLLINAYLVNWWGGFCLLGGPDAKFLSAESFQFGGPALILAVLLIFISARLVPTKAYIYAPIIVVIMAWLARFMPFESAFYAWLFGVPIASVASLAYWVVSRVRRSSRDSVHA
jgi:hypothetical protein